MTPRAAEPLLTMGSPTTEEIKERLPTEPLETSALRPSTSRRSTEPAGPSFSSPLTSPDSLPLHPRNRSPFSRSHLRSHSSSTSALTAPPMTRAHSSPVVDTAGRVLMSTHTRPMPPLGPPTPRRRSPMRRPTEDAYPSYGFSVGIDIGETIAENSELELTPRGPTTSAEAETTDNAPSEHVLSIHNTFPRSRRHPPSLLHPITQTLWAPSRAAAKQLRASASSPSLATMSASRFNESYPSSTPSFSSSSMPSTPTSLRSRSPSISSLETIPDSPDAEEAAVEAEQVALLKAAADGDEGTGRRKGGGVLVGISGGPGYAGVGRGDKRKRWSVCGAERRGDLDLETIWED